MLHISLSKVYCCTTLDMALAVGSNATRQYATRLAIRCCLSPTYNELRRSEAKDILADDNSGLVVELHQDAPSVKLVTAHSACAMQWIALTSVVDGIKPIGLVSAVATRHSHRKNTNAYCEFSINRWMLSVYYSRLTLLPGQRHCAITCRRLLCVERSDVLSHTPFLG